MANEMEIIEKDFNSLTSSLLQFEREREKEEEEREIEDVLRQSPALSSSLLTLEEDTENDAAIAQMMALQEEIPKKTTLSQQKHLDKKIENQVSSKQKPEGKSKSKRIRDFFALPSFIDFDLYDPLHGDPSYYESQWERDRAEQIEYEKAKKRLKKRLQEFDLGEYEVRGDGNCQFRALADQLYRKESLHRVVREIAVKELITNAEKYRQYVTIRRNYDRYVTAMGRSRTWGDHITLQAISNSMNVVINLITSTHSSDDCHTEIVPSFVGEIPKEPNRSIWLSYVGSVHYNSLYPREEYQERLKEDRKCIIQ